MEKKEFVNVENNSVSIGPNSIIQENQELALTNFQIDQITNEQVSENRAHHLLTATELICPERSLKPIHEHSDFEISPPPYKFQSIIEYLRDYPLSIIDAFGDQETSNGLRFEWLSRSPLKRINPYERRVFLFRDAIELIARKKIADSLVYGYKFFNLLLFYKNFRYLPEMPKSLSLAYAEPYSKFFNFYGKLRNSDWSFQVSELWNIFGFQLGGTDKWPKRALNFSNRIYESLKTDDSVSTFKLLMKYKMMEFYTSQITSNINCIIQNLRTRQLFCSLEFKMNDVFFNQSKTLFTKELLANLSIYHTTIRSHFKEVVESLTFADEKFPTDGIIECLVESIYLFDAWLDWSSEFSLLSSKLFTPIRKNLKSNQGFFACFRLFTIPQAEKLIGSVFEELKDGAPTLYHKPSHMTGALFMEGLNTVLHFPENRPLVFKEPTIRYKKLILYTCHN